MPLSNYELMHLDQVPKSVIYGVASLKDVVVPLRCEPLTETLITSSPTAADVAVGNRWYLKNSVIVSGGNGDYVDFLFVVGSNNRRPLMNWELTGGMEFKCTLYRNPTYSSVGTHLDVRNADDSVPPNTSNLLAYMDPTVSDPGDELMAFQFGEGKVGRGGSADGDSVIKLATQTVYLFRMAKQASQNDWFGYSFRWSERQDLHPNVAVTEQIDPRFIP